ncbi:CdaR family protein [Sporosarcina cascadiensis]|uniref:CdaR family protein n=1 Tax=Sporosarcina cascadiensis TaxID=2660747 RepID=UPI00129B2B60|nr:CdaR family protein [Sporosarcina cascadiensis]
MDKFIDSPWFLRLIALFLAVILFFSVQAEDQSNRNTANDVFALIQDVPVEVYYDTENLVVTGVPEMVNMTIEGPANIVQTTKVLKDFTLKLDLQDLTLGEHTVRIQAENLSDKLDVRIEPPNVHVNIEEKVTQSFRIDPEMNTRLLAEGYEVKSMDVQPGSINVTGAKSIVEAISFVKVSVTGDDKINKSFEQKARVRVLDRDLNKLSVSLEPEEVTVKVDVKEYSRDVPLKLIRKGKPAGDLTVESVTLEEQSVRVYGPKSAVDAVKEIPAEVDLSKVSKSGKVEVTIKKPDDVSKVTPNKVKVQVVIAGEPADSDEPDKSEESAAKPVDEETAPPPEDSNPENVTVPSQITQQISEVPISIRNLDAAYTASIAEPANGNVSLQVTGTKEELEQMKRTDILIYIDASDVKTEGRQAAALLVEAPRGITWKLAVRNAVLDIKSVETKA